MLEKSVYKLFEIAKEHSVFSSDLSYFNLLSTEYSLLCRHTHTSTEHEMVKMDGLNALPFINQKDMNRIKNAFDNIVKAMIIVSVSIYRKEFFELQEIYRDRVLASLTSAQKKALHIPK